MAQADGRQCYLITVLLLQVCVIYVVSSCPPPCVCGLQKVVCSGQGLLDIPLMVPGDTVLLDLSNNEIKTIHNESLEGLAQLEHLNLRDNRISQIDSQAFTGLPKLKVLDLDGNQIEHFVKANLSSLAALSVLRLNRNRLLDLECSELGWLGNLTELNARHNKLTVFPDNCFEKLSSLQVLDLSWNKLHLICEHTFIGLPSLHTLLLNNNHLHHAVTPNAFKSLVHLRTLDLAKANIFRLTNKTFSGLANLVHLNLSDNAIKDICQGVFHALVSIETLQLSGNPIDIIPDNGFVKNEQLQQLKLNSMPDLVFFYPKAFHGLSNLILLESRDNKRMQVLHRDVLVPFRHIEVLDFTNSGIQSVHSSVVRNLTSNPQLLLGGNPLKCSCALSWMRVNQRQLRVNISDLDTLRCDSPERLHGRRLIDVPLNNLTCAKATIANRTTSVVTYQIGSSVELKCPALGEPRPSITWVTPSGKNFTYLQYDPYRYWPSEVILAEHVQNGSYHMEHHWHESNKYHTSFGDYQRIHLLDNGNLYIDYVVRGDAGPYSCLVENSGGNDSTVIRLHLDYFVIRQVRDFTCFVGGATAGVALLLSILFASVRACVEKCASACSKRKKTERRGLREILGNIDTYRAERMQTLRDNYHLHVDKIKDQCSQNLLRLRENYHTQISKIRENCAGKIERVRTNYANQKGRLKGYGSHKVEKIRDNYNAQMVKIREYGHNQLKKIHENYKVQQQHILKILEMLNIENCRGVVDAECLRTESMLFDAQLLVDSDSMDTPEAITPDNHSVSDYMTAGSVSEVCSLSDQVTGNRTDTGVMEQGTQVVNETIGDASGVSCKKDDTNGATVFFLGSSGDDLECGNGSRQDTSVV